MSIFNIKPTHLPGEHSLLGFKLQNCTKVISHQLLYYQKFFFKFLLQVHPTLPLCFQRNAKYDVARLVC